ncbi:ABC transporter substrate-binding protein, partial [Mesorhizobium sp. M7A.F.Ca.US.005.03.2.1]
MTDKNGFFDLSRSTLTRRTALKGLAAGAGLGLAPGFVRYSQAQSSAPIKIGFQSHRTGIGAAYGRWYEKTTAAAVKAINAAGGINGRQVEVIIEDDGTDPGRGAEVVGKFATQHKTDIVFGTLFSHVVIGSAPAAGENKMPYFVVSEGHHVASTKLNRYVFQPGITDVKSQIQSMAPWIAANAGKKVTQIFPDFAFGYDHRDYLPPALKAQGGEVIAQIAIPPTESSFTKYFPQIPAETEVIYHVMVGPAVLTFVKELGEFYGSNRPQLFGFIDSL